MVEAAGREPICRKALLDALCLMFWNLAIPKTFVKRQSNNDAQRYVVSDIRFADSL